MLINWEECRTQVQLRSDQDRLMATLVDLSYLTWQEAPHLVGQVPNHLSHPSGWSPSDSQDSWDNGQPGWIPYHEGLPRDPGGLSAFSGGGPPYDPHGGPSGFTGRVPLGSPWSPGRCPLGTLASKGGGPLGPPTLSGLSGGGPLVHLSPLLEVALDCLDLLMEVPQVHMPLKEVALWITLVTWDLKAHPDSCSCGKVAPH